jgi:hypothetical protein
MYDYLAKIILLGPSGSGKYVSRQTSCSLDLELMDRNTDLVSSIDLSRTNGGS